MTSKSDSIGITCISVRHFAYTFSQWNSCWKKNTRTLDGKQMWLPDAHLCYLILNAARPYMVVLLHGQSFLPRCTNRILQIHQQNPVVPSESGVHPQNLVCTYSVLTGIRLQFVPANFLTFKFLFSLWRASVLLCCAQRRKSSNFLLLKPNQMSMLVHRLMHHGKCATVNVVFFVSYT